LIQQEIDKITEKRFKAQGALQHYEKKLKENHEAVEQESHIAELLEQEFKVNRARFMAFLLFFFELFLHFFYRIGRTVLFSIVNELRILVR